MDAFYHKYVKGSEAVSLLQLHKGAVGNHFPFIVLDEHILNVWRHLTQSLTNNAAEHFNRKIEKCLAGRYGFSSTTSVEVLLRGLWLKELILNGHKHLAATSQIVELDLTEICQEALNVDKILHNFDESALSRTEKLA